MDTVHNCREHFGEQLSVGPYIVWAGSIRLAPWCLDEVNVLVTLTNRPAYNYRADLFPKVTVHHLPLPDFGGVTEDWPDRVREVMQVLENGKRIAFHCAGGFGRTGTILASLVALLESPEETPDPIQAIRERYCPRAVETDLQAAAVFALRGQSLPQDYPGLVPAHGG